MNPYIGTSLQSLLEELGEWDEVKARAQKKLVADQIRRAMEQAQITKSELAKRMKTSRSQLDDILNPDDPGLTLITLSKVSYALGLEPRITFEKVVVPTKKSIHVVKEVVAKPASKGASHRNDAKDDRPRAQPRNARQVAKRA